jgi:hypothetical protein
MQWKEDKATKNESARNGNQREDGNKKSVMEGKQKRRSELAPK